MNKSPSKTQFSPNNTFILSTRLFGSLYHTMNVRKLMEMRMHLQKTFCPIMVAKIFGTRVTRICSLISQLSSDWRDENLKYMTSKRHELKLPTYEYWRQLHTVSFVKPLKRYENMCLSKIKKDIEHENENAFNIFVFLLR